MGLFVFKVLDGEGNPTGEEVEEIFSHKDVPDEIHSKDGRVARRTISLVARTPGRWGDTNRRYDPFLRASYSSIAERDRICHEKGVTPTDDLPAGLEESLKAKDRAYSAHWDKEVSKWETICKKHGVYEDSVRGSGAGDKINDEASARAWAEYAPAQEALSGNHGSTKTLITDF